MARFDNTQALTEGWAVFECSGLASDSPETHRIERLYEDAVFDSDMDAWWHVIRCALSGSDYHKSAIHFIAEVNPLEYKRIENHAAYLGLIAPGQVLNDAINGELK